MIPRVLQIKNFLSYSAQVQEVDFRPYSLVCLSGKNGHGKSALLDAMTWALWGHARKTQGVGKPDEGLVRMGQSRLFVSFEFETGGDVFRVRREFFKAHGRPVSSLEFQVLDKKTDQFSSLTDKTIRATQQKIEKTVGLDYDTFINTSFFKQGSSNEFSRKTPKERKQILSRIMGLEKYDQMSAKAQELVRSSQEKLSGVLAVQDNVRKELEKLPELKAKFEKAKQELEKAKVSVLAGRKKVSELEDKVRSCDSVLALKNELDNKKDLLSSAFTDWRTVHRQIVSAPEMSALNKVKDELRVKEERLLVGQKQYFDIAKQTLAFEVEVKDRVQLLTATFQRRKELSELEIKTNKLEADGQKKELERLKVFVQQIKHKKDLLLEKRVNKETEAKQLACDQQDQAALQTRLEKQLEYKEFLSSQIRNCRDELFRAQGALKTFEGDKGLCCPTCGQDVGQKTVNHMREELTEKINFLNAHGRKIKAALELCNERVLASRTKLSEVGEKLLKAKVVQAEIQAFGQDLVGLEKEFAQANQTVESEQTKLDKVLIVRAKLDEKFKVEFGCPEKLEAEIAADMQIKELGAKLADSKQLENSLGVCQDQLKEVRNELSVLEQTLSIAAKADSERRAQEVRKQALLEQYGQIKSSLKQFFSQFEKAAQERESSLLLKTKLVEEQKVMEAQAQEIFKEFGSSRQELSRVQELEQNSKKMESEIATIKQEADDYSVLSGAFGKNGIQALIIESIIPEIEFEANKIMSRLTDDQTKVFIEPLKDLKKGGYKESLDIKISDSAGVRPYEMFSGGEAFRIDFALRISISKLLARRAGASLQTLIIDEGFGSQDQEGIARLMEAINHVRTDFSKVIVVSHLEEMKNEFPVHFLVTKKPTGSTVSVEYKG